VNFWIRLLVWSIPLGIVGLGVYGYLEGTPLDVVNAVTRNDVASVKAAIARDPQAVHIKVYPQGYGSASQQAAYRATTGRDAWGGRYLIHQALGLIDPLPMLELLAGAGADLSVRLGGRTLLHLAASKGDEEVVSWLLERGADINAANTCEENCPERGQTPLFDAQNFRDQELTPFLIARGADPHVRALNGRTALHASAVIGSVSGAFELCRHGTNPTLKDVEGRTARDLALAADAAGRDAGRTLLYGPGEQADWLKPGGGCETLAARAAATGSPVSEEDAGVVFRIYACARGATSAC
jgi:ankyrin repeat protein